MKLGLLLSVTGLKVGDFREGAALARGMGYDSVELGGCDLAGAAPCADLGSWDEGAAAHLAADIRSSGLGISALQVHVDYIFPDERERLRRLGHTMHMIDLAEAMDVDVVHTVSGPLRPGMEEARAWEQLADAYTRLCNYAALTAVRLAIEPVFVYLVGNLETTRRLLDLVGRDDLYINFDPSHFPYHHEDPIPFIEALGQRIVHAHAKDATVTDLVVGAPLPRDSFYMGNGQAFAFAPPGRGLLDWPALIAALRAADFEGVLSLELGHGIPDEVAAARETAQFLRPLP